MKSMKCRKEYKNWMLVLLVTVWFMYVLLNVSDFQAIDNLSKNVVLSEVTQEKEEYFEGSGEFKAKQYRIHSYEVRFKQKVQPDRIEIVLSDKNGKVVSNVSYEPKDKLKKHRIEKEVYIRRNEVYAVSVRVYSEKAELLSTCKVNYNAFLKLDYITAVCCAFLSIAVLILNIIRKKNSCKDKKKISYGTIFSIVLQSGVSFFVVEYIFRNDILVNIIPKMIFVNWGIYLAVYLIVFILLNSSKHSALICNSFFCVWGIANQYVYLFKRQALMPIDLKSLRTAANVATEYDYTLTPEMCVALSVVILCSVLWLCSQDRKLICGFSIVKKSMVGIAGIVLGAVLWYVLFVSEFIPGLEMSIDMWNSQASYYRNGTVLSFCGYWHLAQVKEPENYSAEKVSMLVENVELKDSESSATRPNIVVIMNEAFVDLSCYGTFETNVPYMENYNAISENAVKGHALVNIIGGGTANSEYEYLTGHSLAFMSTSIPYAQHIQEEHFSMATNLSVQGYETVAIHPLDGINWRRNVVYPYLGFDEFIAMENMDKENAEYVRQYISDNYTYKLIMDILRRNSENPTFIFDVTVQNHSGYVYEKDDFREVVKVVGYDSSEVNQYLSLIKLSDEELGNLIQELEGFEEPTVLVFFGDHYPTLPEDFFNWINPESAVSSVESIQKRYSVPFLIWANYDIEEEAEVITSLNYLGARTLEIAGVEMSRYDRYRLKLAEEIPAINTVGYVDAQGKYRQLQDSADIYEKLQEYWILIYNELMDTKNCLKSFFGIKSK